MSAIDAFMPADRAAVEAAFARAKVDGSIDIEGRVAGPGERRVRLEGALLSALRSSRRSRATSRPRANLRVVPPLLPDALQARFNVATLMAIVLSDMLPEYRAAIFRRATEYAENRVVGGVHYRSDIVAGRTAGALIALRLQGDDAFMAAFRPARDALRHVMELPAAPP